MPTDDVPTVGVPESRGESFGPDPLLDDWLGDEAELDWFSEPDGTTGRRKGPARAGQGRDGRAGVDDLGTSAAQAARIVLRRRAVGLAALLLVAAAVVAIALAVVGGSNRSSSAPTTPVTTTTPASTTTAKPPTTTPRSSAQTGASLTLVLSATGKLRSGDTGTAVKTLQQALSTLGFDSGSADGIFGPATERAVVAFQQANGLAADGIVGPKTTGKINAALAGRSTG